MNRDEPVNPTITQNKNPNPINNNYSSQQIHQSKNNNNLITSFNPLIQQIINNSERKINKIYKHNINNIQ